MAERYSSLNHTTFKALLAACTYSVVQINTIRNSDGHNTAIHVHLYATNYKTLQLKHTLCGITTVYNAIKNTPK